MIRALLVVSVSIFLAACQTRIDPSPSSDDAWVEDANLPLLEEIPNDWRLSAKVGLSIDGKAEQANLVWRRVPQLSSPRNNEISLFGPFGSGAVQLAYGERTVVLTDSKAKQYWGEDAQQLLTEIVGWPLPLDALGFWLFAQPAPDMVYRYQIAEDDKLSAIQQANWRIEFKDWRDFNGRTLPRKIFAYRENDSLDAQSVSVKLVVKSWQWN